MKATARAIRGSVRAVATVTSGLAAAAITLPTGIQPKAEATEQAGVRHFLTVAPEEAQQLVWLVPQVGVDYTVTTSTNLKWRII
jgi:hypothetical protein